MVSLYESPEVSWLGMYLACKISALFAGLLGRSATNLPTSSTVLFRIEFAGCSAWVRSMGGTADRSKFGRAAPLGPGVEVGY